MTEKQLEKKILDGGRTLLFSNEDLKRLIIPLVIDQVLARTVGMADTMMISSVGEAAISGVSLVDMINMLINAVFAAVATGGAVIASQYLGHRDRKKACEASSQLMVVTAVCALLFTVLSLAARKPLLSLLFGQIDADVMDAALTYLTVSALSFPFLASFNSSSALFRAMNDSRTPTVVSLGMNVMNLIGNSILIFGMKTEEVNTLKARGYRPEDYYNNNPVIKSCIDRMYAGINGCKFTEVADSLRTLDPYMVLADFDSYCQVQEHSSKLYTDKDTWTKMSLHNIANAGIFSADRAVNEYAKDIWNI